MKVGLPAGSFRFRRAGKTKVETLHVTSEQRHQARQIYRDNLPRGKWKVVEAVASFIGLKGQNQKRERAVMAVIGVCIFIN
ncbi:MAG: hypothetical protein AAF514_17300 [Verrucomicrobiota bacterium]